MVDAYLQWKYYRDAGAAPTQSPSPSPHPDILPTTPTNNASPREAPPTNSSSDTRTVNAPANDLLANDISAGFVSTNQSPPRPPDDSKDFTPPPGVTIELAAIDIYTLSTSIKVNVPNTGEDTTASALARLGFIGNAPFTPSVAVSIKTLELYRSLRRRKPSFSIEAFVKVISDLYLVCPTIFTVPSHSHLEVDPVPYQVSSRVFRRV